MKIYVITHGEYSDYHICCVTDDRTKAELLKEKYSDEWSQAEIEEYDTDEVSEIISNKNAYTVRFDNDGNFSIQDCDFNLYDKKFTHYKNGLCIDILADTEEEAIKKASDKRAKYLAEELGL